MDFSIFSTALLFIISLCSSVVSNIVRAIYVKKTIAKKSDFYLLNSFVSAFATLIIFLLSGFKFQFSIFTIIVGVAFGLITACCSIFNSFALKTGPVSYTQIIINMSTVITGLSGVVFWKEQLKYSTIIGIVLMILCFFLSVNTSENEKKANLKWFVFALLSMLFCAFIGLIQKIHQTSDFKNELFEMLYISFFIGTIASIVSFVFVREKEKKIGKQNISMKRADIKSVVLSAFLIGVGCALNNVLNLYLSGVVDTAIFFPLANGVPLISMILLSFVIFKEKLSKKQWVGFIVGLVATIILCIW